MTGLRLAPDKTGGQGGAPNLQSPDYVSTGGKGDLSENWSTISLNSSAHTTPASYKKGKVFSPFAEVNIIKNVSSSTSHKKTPFLRPYVFPSFRLSLRDFKKILPNTFIYESILIKIYMNTNVMNTQIFYFYKYDLKGH